MYRLRQQVGQPKVYLYSNINFMEDNQIEQMAYRADVQRIETREKMNVKLQE